MSCARPCPPPPQDGQAAQRHDQGPAPVRTLQSLPGSWGHYAQDAKTFASWGVDFVKVDMCGGLPTWTTVNTLTENFRQFGTSLREYNPAVVYSEELPIYQIGKPGFLATVRSSAEFANMWRVANDEYPLNHANTSPMILGHLAADLHLHAFAGPDHWNDLDMPAGGDQRRGGHRVAR